MATTKPNTFKEELAKRKNSGGGLRGSDADELPYNPKQVAALETWMRVVLDDEKKEMDAEAFFESLCDGTRLCRLLNFIHPELIDEKEIKKRLKPTYNDCTDNITLFTKARDETYRELNRHKRFKAVHLLERGGNQDLNFVVQSLYALALILCKSPVLRKKKTFTVIDQTHFQDASAEADDSEDECKDDSEPNQTNNSRHRPRVKMASNDSVKSPHINAPPDVPEDHGDVQAQKQWKLQQRAAALQADDEE